MEFMQFEHETCITRSHIKQRILSHEGKSELLSFTRDCKQYPLAWGLFQGGRGSPTAGIDQISNALELMPVPHPFAIDPQTVDTIATFVSAASVLCAARGRSILSDVRECSSSCRMKRRYCS